MHVEIEHVAKEGGFFSGKAASIVKIRIQLSPAEADIVERRRLWKYVVIKEKNQRYVHASERDKEIMNEFDQYNIRKLIDGTETYLDTPSEAKAFAEKVRQNLKDLKSFIDGNDKDGNKETFDL